MGNFKIGDNINYNLKILTLLYGYFNKTKTTDEQKKLLCKPITILYDFYSKISTLTKEGVKNIKNNTLISIRGKRIDQLEKYIANTKKHNFFDSNNNEIYKNLDLLRRTRNRIHIQNTKQ